MLLSHVPLAADPLPLILLAAVGVVAAPAVYLVLKLRLGWWPPRHPRA